MKNNNTRAVVNEKGVALMMVLILSAIMLGIMAGLVYMLVASTQVSGIQKRYKTALDAGKGGANLTYELIANRGTLGSLDPTQITFAIRTATACMTAKMISRTSDWTACPSDSSTSYIDTANSASYDLFVEIGTTARYQIYSKIVDTVEGNSGGDLGLIKSGVVTNSGEVQAMSRPYLYTIEVDAQNRDNPAERAQYSILYQY